jgi:S-adenosyl-L-methionine hydrolase (adenosine-forming)
MSRPIITLTTDFGLGSPYVAEMKGVMLAICPDVHLVDVCHAVPPQDIRSGALILGDTTGCFPPGTIHVAVVDPGVGTARRVVGLACEGMYFFGPDNGIFSRVLAGREPHGLVELTEQRYWRGVPSRTFHGRDILAPVAAHCARGIPLNRLGTPCTGLRGWAWAEPAVDRQGIRGECLTIDAFGNVITNITRNLLGPGGTGDCELEVAGRTIRRFVQAYGEAGPGELIALFGSQDRLEIAQVHGSAARVLQAVVGMPVRVRRLPDASRLDGCLG